MDIHVQALSMSGRQIDLVLRDEEPVALMRQKVSEALGVGKWQLRLIHDGQVLEQGLIKELTTEKTLEVMALVVENPAVTERSQQLRQAFRRKQLRGGDAINRHEEAILNGEVAFDFEGDNLMELLLSNWSPDLIERPLHMLLAGGASVNSRSNDGYTPLLTACSRGLGKAAKLLLQHGADPLQRLAHGDRDDALSSALKFFQACCEVNSWSREDDLDLGRTCCLLRAANIQAAPALLPLEQARLKLSQAAIELTLLGCTVSVCQKRVLEKSLLEPALATAFGEDLWEGWPQAFFTFSLKIPKVAGDWDKDFCAARHRILTYTLSKNGTSPLLRPRRNFPRYYSDDLSVYSDCCTCPFCCPALHDSPRMETDSFVTSYQMHKNQNQKWKSSKENVRRSRRAPFASSGRVSRSSRMARKLPRNSRRFQVEHVLQGERKSPSKLQVLKEELGFDCCGLI